MIVSHKAPGLSLLRAWRLLEDHAFTLGRVVATVPFLEVESVAIFAILAVQPCLGLFGFLSRRSFSLGLVLAPVDGLDNSHRFRRVSAPPQDLVDATAMEVEVAVWAVGFQHGPVVRVQEDGCAGPVEGEHYGGLGVQAVNEGPPVEPSPRGGSGHTLHAQQQQRQCQDRPGLPVTRVTRRHANLGSIQE